MQYPVQQLLLSDSRYKGLVLTVFHSSASVCAAYIKSPPIKYSKLSIWYRGPPRGGPSYGGASNPLVCGCGHCDTSRRSRRWCICLLLCRIIRSVIFVLVVARIVLLTTIDWLLRVIVLRSAVCWRGRVLSGVSSAIIAVCVTSRGCNRLVAGSHGQNGCGVCGLAPSHHADDAECAEAAYEDTDHCV